METENRKLETISGHLGGSCTKKEFEETIDLIASGMIDPEKYVTDVLPLSELQRAFEKLTSKTDPVLKIVIRP